MLFDGIIIAGEEVSCSICCECCGCELVHVKLVKSGEVDDDEGDVRENGYQFIGVVKKMSLINLCGNRYLMKNAVCGHAEND